LRDSLKVLRVCMQMLLKIGGIVEIIRRLFCSSFCYRTVWYLICWKWFISFLVWNIEVPWLQEKKIFY